MGSNSFQKHMMKIAGKLVLGLFIVFILFFGIVGLGAWLTPKGPSVAEAKAAIEDHNYKDPQDIKCVFWGSHVTYGCSGGEAFACPATAVTVTGKRIPVVACTDIFFKGWTVRTPRAPTNDP